MQEIAVIGAGSWGTAIAILLAKKEYKVSLWARDASLAEASRKANANVRFLAEASFPPSLEITASLEKAVQGAKVAVMAVPSAAFRAAVEKVLPVLDKEAVLLSLAKGLEFPSLLRMSQIMMESGLDDKRIAVLSGPNHAEEVVKDIPSATVVASRDKDTAHHLQEIFMTPFFRVYSSNDVAGVELGGAVKNVIAIAAGISDGLGYGDNTKASLITRGLVELSRLGTELGGDPRTLSGLSGLGDLIVTCMSQYSRNRYVGQQIGKGISLEKVTSSMKMVAEGVITAQAVVKLAEVSGVEMPICRAVYEVLYENRNPLDCVSALMERDPADEL